MQLTCLQFTSKEFIHIILTGSVSGGNKCSQLKSPPSGVDVCPFVGDDLTLTCTTNVPLISGTIYPVSSIVSIGVSDGGIFHCNASNVCGASRSDLTVQVFGNDYLFHINKCMNG